MVNEMNKIMKEEELKFVGTGILMLSLVFMFLLVVGVILVIFNYGVLFELCKRALLGFGIVLLSLCCVYALINFINEDD
jgi:Na+/phosphate symporter